MTVLADENVPIALVEYLRSLGQTVTRAQDVTPPQTDDRVIIAIAERMRATVLTWNVKHFLPTLRRQRARGTDRVRSAGLIGFECDESVAVRRMQEFRELIAFEFEHVQSLRDKRLVLVVMDQQLRVIR